MPTTSPYISVKDFGAIGDGVTDDTDAIDRAIQHLKKGDCLYFPAGTYIVSSSLTPLPPNTSVRCYEGAWLKRSVSAPNIAFFTVLGFNHLVVNIDGNDQINGSWVAESFGVYSNIAQPASHVKVTHSRFRNIMTGIRADGITNWHVSSNSFENIKNSAILAGSSIGAPVKYNSFANNTFNSTGDYAIAFYPQTEGDCEIAYCSVMGNIAKDTQLRTNGYAFGIESGINNTMLHSNSFIGNIVEQITDSGFGQGGIVLGQHCRDSLISNNILGGHGGQQASGITSTLCAGIQISGNQIANFSGPGIDLEGSQDVLATNNIIKDCGGGSPDIPSILISLGALTNMIQISGNLIGCGPTSKSAITGYVDQDVPNLSWIIRGNTIKNARDFGIFLNGVGPVLITNAQVIDNLLTTHGSVPSRLVYIRSGSDCIISGNVLFNTQSVLDLIDCIHTQIGYNKFIAWRPELEP